MTEAQWQQQVLDLAQLGRWRVAHFRPAQTAKGWRTPVAADGAGWPDLTLTHTSPPRLILAELKGTGGRLSRKQEDWLWDLGLVERRIAEALAQPLPAFERIVQVYVWRPEDFPEVRRVLLERRS